VWQEQALQGFKTAEAGKYETIKIMEGVKPA